MFLAEGISKAQAQVLQSAGRLVYASLVLRRNIVSDNVFDDAYMSVTLTYVEPIKRSNRARYTVNIYGDDANPIYCNFIVDQTKNVSLEQYVEAVLSVATLESWCVIQTTTTKGRSTVYCITKNCYTIEHCRHIRTRDFTLTMEHRQQFTNVIPKTRWIRSCCEPV